LIYSEDLNFLSGRMSLNFSKENWWLFLSCSGTTHT